MWEKTLKHGASFNHIKLFCLHWIYSRDYDKLWSYGVENRFNNDYSDQPNYIAVLRFNVIESLGQNQNLDSFLDARNGVGDINRDEDKKENGGLENPTTSS